MIRRSAGPPGTAGLAPDGEAARKNGAVSRLMLVEGHSLFRQALVFLLDRERGLETVAQAGTLADARRLISADVDVAVVDHHLPDGSGVDLVGDLRGLNPRGIVLVLVEEPEEFCRAIESGAGEVLDKSATAGQVVEAVKRLGGQSNQ